MCPWRRVQAPLRAGLWMDGAERRDDAGNFTLPRGTIYLGPNVPARQLYWVKCERMRAPIGVQNTRLSPRKCICKHRYQISVVPFMKGPPPFPSIALNYHFIRCHGCMWPGCSDVLEPNFNVLENPPPTPHFKSPPSLPWVMFSKVDPLRRSKQEWMPGLACKERQINKTAGQLMRSSFAEIDLCGHFWFGDKKSVCGRGLLICRGSLSAWSMLHWETEALALSCYYYLFYLFWRKTHTQQGKWTLRSERLGAPDRRHQKEFGKPGSHKLMCAWRPSEFHWNI